MQIAHGLKYLAKKQYNVIIRRGTALRQTSPWKLPREPHRNLLDDVELSGIIIHGG